MKEESFESGEVDIVSALKLKVIPEPTEAVPEINEAYFDKVGKEIFQAWYDHQEAPVTTVVRSIERKNCDSAEDEFYNLFCEGYLFTRRALDRSRTKGEYGDPAELAIDDVRFQQSLVLASFTRAKEDIDLFWKELQEYQRDLGRTAREVNALQQGVHAMLNGVAWLRAEGYEVFLPDPRIDAQDKIDLVCKKGGEWHLVQVKSEQLTERVEPHSTRQEDYISVKSKKTGERDRNQKVERFFESIQSYSKAYGTKFTGELLSIPVRT